MVLGKGIFGGSLSPHWNLSRFRCCGVWLVYRKLRSSLLIVGGVSRPVVEGEPEVASLGRVAEWQHCTIINNAMKHEDLFDKVRSRCVMVSAPTCLFTHPLLTS